MYYIYKMYRIHSKRTEKIENVISIYSEELYKL